MSPRGNRVLESIFSPLVPGITANSVLRRLLHALYIHTAPASPLPSPTVTLTPILHHHCTVSQLSRNIATIHRNHAQTWYQQERDRQKNATGHGKKSSDAIIQFMHFCCYSMAVVNEPLITYTSVYHCKSPWKMAHELRTEELGDLTGNAIEQLLGEWRPMPSRKGTNYLVALTPLGQQWVVSHLAIAIVKGKVTIRSLRDLPEQDNDPSMTASAPSSPSVSLLGKRDRESGEQDPTGDSVLEQQPAKRQCTPERTNAGWTEQVLVPLCHSLEQAVEAHRAMHPQENMGPWITALFKEHAPNTFGRISEQVMFSHFSRLLSEEDSQDVPSKSIRTSLDVLSSLEEEDVSEEG